MTDTSDSESQALEYSDLIDNLTENFNRCQNIMAGFTEHCKTLEADPLNLADAYTRWMSEAAKNPFHLVGAGLNYWQDSLKLYQQALPSMMGVRTEPVIEPEPDDRRFRHEAWMDNPLYDFVKQSYLLASKWVRDSVNGHSELDEKIARKVEFFTERYVDALSPTNFVATNPAVLEKTLETKGANLVMGLKNIARRPGTGQRPAAHAHDRRDRLRTWRERRRHAGQGGVPEPDDAVDPVYAHDGNGVQTPASDRAALDQQVLYHGPAAA